MQLQLQLLQYTDIDRFFNCLHFPRSKNPKDSRINFFRILSKYKLSFICFYFYVL